MSKPSVKKPFNLFHWLVLGVVSGVVLGIIIGLTLSTIGLINTERPYGPPSWEIIKWTLSRVAIMYGLYGAIYGGIIGLAVGLIKIPRE